MESWKLLLYYVCSVNKWFDYNISRFILQYKLQYKLRLRVNKTKLEYPAVYSRASMGS